MDFREFITRHEDIKETESYYGKFSRQYEAHQKMDEIIKYLQKQSILLGKQCAQEFITVHFIYGRIESCKIKKHWNLEKTEVKKRKETTYPGIDFNKLADEAFDLVWKNGYKIIDVDKI